MDLNEFITALADTPPASGYVATDRDGELRYMEAHRFHFDRIDATLPDVDVSLRVLDIGTTTVKTKWEFARTWLRRETQG